MKVDLEFLKLKKEMFIREAEKYLDLQQKSGSDNHTYLVKALVNEPEFVKGNLPFCFVQRCIKNTDNIFEQLPLYAESNTLCSIDFSDDVIKFWQSLNKKFKKNRPERGDVVVGHYNRKDSVVTNGFLGIVKSVDANLNMEIIEATVINNYDEEPRAQQFDGIKFKVRSLTGKGKSRILGIFTPWFF